MEPNNEELLVVFRVSDWNKGEDKTERRQVVNR